MSKSILDILIESRLAYLRNLEDSFPDVRWREPIKISTPFIRDRLGCRICIAQKGLKGEQVKFLPETLEQFQKHMKEYHFIEI